MTPAGEITEAALADLGLIRSVAAGYGVRIAPDLLAAVQRQRAEAMQALADGQLVYGVNTGMGALSKVRLTERQQRFSPAQPAAGAGHGRSAVAGRAGGTSGHHGPAADVPVR